MADDRARTMLHGRARAFIAGTAAGEATDETFDALGVSIARYQAERVPAYARLLAARGIDVSRVDALSLLPAVPTDAFRLARIAAHPPRLDRAVFRTSATTALARGEHVMSTTETYEAAALAWGKWGLFPERERSMIALVLAQAGAGDSSLGFMMELFAQTFATEVHFVVEMLADGHQSVNVERLARVCDEAGETPVLIMGTSFAYVHALDALGDRQFTLPQGSRAMHTGGFKGRSREVPPDELRRAIATAFGLLPLSVVGEYGMTELSSQLYEGTLRALRGLPTPSERHGVFVAPPWMRVIPVDPESLSPVPVGDVGILRFEDLANVDSAVAIQTADRGRLVAGGVELLGRAAGAPPRGCSIAVDELMSRPSP